VTPNDAGFSLLEVVVSFSLFAIVAGGATTGIVSALQAAHTSQQRIDAANVAQRDLALVFAAYSSGSGVGAIPVKASYVQAVGSERFSVVRTVAMQGSATACSPGQSFRVDVQVSQQQTGTFLAQTDTVIAC
jgi:prepilin-type N-terminal cleavage/methylation domain-containing protein